MGKRGFFGGIIGFAVSVAAFYLIWVLLFHITDPIPDRWENWVILLAALAVPTVAGVWNAWEWEWGFSGVLRYAGKLLLAVIGGNMAAFVLGAVLSLAVMLLTGDVEGLLSMLLPTALLLGLVGTPAGGVLVIVFRN